MPVIAASARRRRRATPARMIVNITALNGTIVGTAGVDLGSTATGVSTAACVVVACACGVADVTGAAVLGGVGVSSLALRPKLNGSELLDTAWLAMKRIAWPASGAAAPEAAGSSDEVDT